MQLRKHPHTYLANGNKSSFKALFMGRALLIFGALLALIGTTVWVNTYSLQAQSPVIYYLDCSAGIDTNSGTAVTQAWKSITKANTAPLRPGDKLLLKRGCAWKGPLKAAWNGTATQPITIGAYGTGALPKIQDSYNVNIQISGSYQIIEYLEATQSGPVNPDPNCNNQSVAWKVGFSFAGTASYNTLSNSKASNNAMGIRTDYDVHHNKIINNAIVNNTMVWELTSTATLGGMGILLHGDYNEVGHNYFSNNKSICTYTGTAESNSVELYGARYSNIHHNTAINDRVFSEIGGGTAHPSSDNTFAYNLHVVTFDDPTGARFIVTRGVGHKEGPVYRTLVYNNTIYFTPEKSKAISCAKCAPDILVVKNNVLWANREPISIDGSFVEENNFFGSPTGNPLINFSTSLSSKIGDPQFVDPAANNFRLKSSSLAINSGTLDAFNAGYNQDLALLAVPQGNAVDMGAYELLAVATPTTTPVPPSTPVNGSPTPTPTATASPTAPPPATPVPGLTCMLTLNDGALYIGSSTVQVRASVIGATQMLVSNDAGFGGGTWQPYQANFNWDLRDTGGRIATLVVYARFRDNSGADLCGSGQVSDDIILDPLPPTVSVSLVGATASAVSGSDNAIESQVILEIAAQDQENGSGVERMQINFDGDPEDVNWQPYQSTVTVAATAGQTVFVRIQDMTGNISEMASVTIPDAETGIGPNANPVFLPLITN